MPGLQALHRRRTLPPRYQGLDARQPTASTRAGQGRAGSRGVVKQNGPGRQVPRKRFAQRPGGQAQTIARTTVVEHQHGHVVVQAVVLGKPLRWPLGCAPGQLAGRAVGPVSRRGKYLWLPLLRAGVPEGGLLLHLGMSGSLNLADAPGAPGLHDHFDLHTSRGVLRLTDPRRFGAVVWSAALTVDPARKLLAGLGAEPFDATLTGHDGAVNGLVVHRDRLLSASADRTIREWALGTWAALRTVVAYEQGVRQIPRCLAVSGSKLISGSAFRSGIADKAERCEVRVWDLGTLECEHTLPQAAGAQVRCLAAGCGAVWCCV
jgi:hypothetical protein